MNSHPGDEYPLPDQTGATTTDESIPSYTYPDDDLIPPTLTRSLALEATWGETVPITAQVLALSGPPAVLIDISIVKTPIRGVLLRDGFALTSGDVFTQEDIDRGRIAYRHDGEQSGDDCFTIATPAGEVTPTELRVIVVEPPRQAPVLTGPGSLDGVLDGCRIDQLAGLGVALVALSGRGRWERGYAGGWVELPDVHHGAALLLGPTDSIRFVPRAGWSGTVKLTYRLWDGTGHTMGEVVNLSSRCSVGGTTPFSAEVATASLRVEAAVKLVKPEPPAPWLSPLQARDISGEGFAVVRLEGPGVWQFSLDGGQTWREFGATYHGRSRLLGPSDHVRFVPRPGQRGKVVMSGRAWDGVGQSGSTVCLASAESISERSPFGERVVTLNWRL